MKPRGRRAGRSGPIGRLGRGAVTIFFLATVRLQAGMSPDAQAAVNRGIKAAKQDHDYLLAIRYFQEARALVPVPPDAPDIFLNLGLAEAKLPGRELRAVGWLSAYLSTSRSAENEAAVKGEIAVLQTRNRGNLLHLITTLQKAADMARFPNPWLKILAWADLARDQSVAGDVAGSREVFTKELAAANLISNAPGKSFALSAIAEAQAEAAGAQAAAGDVTGAKVTFASALQSAGLIEDTILAQKGFTRAHIAQNQFAAGDIVGALQTTALIEEIAAKDYAMGFLPDALAQAGSIPTPDPAVNPPPTEATPLPAEMGTMADLVLRHLAKTQEYRDLQAAAALLEEQVQAGWAARDEATVLVQRLNALRADAAATSIIEKPHGRTLQYSVGGSKVADDGIPVAALDRSFPYRSNIAEAIAQNIVTSPPDAIAQAALGRFLAWGHLITNAAPQDPRRITLADWLARLDEADPAVVCALNTPPFLDLVACLGALPQSSDQEQSFEAPAAVVAKLAAAQTSLDQMLSAAARQELDENREDTAERLVKAGDLAGAQETADLIRDPKGQAQTQDTIDEARADFTLVQAKADNFAGAQETAELIRDERGEKKAKVFGQIAWMESEHALAQVHAGDLNGAVSTTKKIQYRFLPGVAEILKGRAWAAIAVARAKAGDLAAAQQSLDLAQENYGLAQNVPGPDGAEEKELVKKGIDLAQEILAEAQVHAGDLPGALATAARMRSDADSPQDRVRNSIVAAQVKAGDLAGAQATADLIRDEGWRQVAQDVLATAKKPATAEDAKP